MTGHAMLACKAGLACHSTSLFLTMQRTDCSSASKHLQTGPAPHTADRVTV
jgi:hypothetical protein